MGINKSDIFEGSSAMVLTIIVILTITLITSLIGFVKDLGCNKVQKPLVSYEFTGGNGQKLYYESEDKFIVCE